MSKCSGLNIEYFYAQEISETLEPVKYEKLKNIIINTRALDIILIMALVFLIILMVDIFIDIIPGK